MTCIFEGLGGNVAARDKILRLVIDSQQSLVAISDNTAFEKHIAAMIVSDQNLYGGADVTLIRTCADQRGLATLAETDPGDSSPPQVTAVVDPATPDGATAPTPAREGHLDASPTRSRPRPRAAATQ